MSSECQHLDVCFTTLRQFRYGVPVTIESISVGDSAVIGIAGRGTVLFVDGPLEATLGFKERAGRLVVVELDVKAERVTGRLLAQIPLGRIEEIVNQPELAAQLMSRFDVTGPSILDLAVEDGVAERLAQLDIASAPTPEPLRIPAGRSYPDEFYSQVASTYAWHAATSSRPAAVIAERAGVGVSTVHRWVKEARRRGLMAPSSRNRNGSTPSEEE